MITISAARILCFGDSNTWGQMPDARQRYAADERWTGIMQMQLGTGFDVIEEGLNGRTTDADYANRPGRNGKTYLTPCVQSQNPLSGVIVMLGTNDCKTEFDRSAADIAAAIHGLVSDIRASARNEQGDVPKILLVSPVPPNPDAEHFKETAHELSAEIAKIAAAAGCDFFDAGTVAQTGVDGVHLTKESHAKLARALAIIVREWA